MKTLKQLQKLCNDGHEQVLYDEVMSYGKITLDHRFDIDEGYHKGSHRELKVDHQSVEWLFSLHNGIIREYGYN